MLIGFSATAIHNMSQIGWYDNQPRKHCCNQAFVELKNKASSRLNARFLQVGQPTSLLTVLVIWVLVFLRIMQGTAPPTQQPGQVFLTH